MTNSCNVPAEWTTSRIMRLLRPLKSKCVVLSTYLKETQAETATTHGNRCLGRSQELMPLKVPANIGVRIHFNQDTIQTIELSKKIYAVRDCYYDILSKDTSAVEKTSNTRTLSSLANVCSVILGAQIPCETEEAEETSNQAETLYDAVPPQYRLRTLFMHALHVILDLCPPNAGLYLSLLDITLERRLYHESEVLLDAIMEFALEASQTNPPRISNPAHRRFLVNLYSKWSLRYSSHVFIQLVTGALQRATSEVVWVSKATRRLALKLARYDASGLPILLAGLMNVIFERKKTFKPTHSLETQLREWLHLCAEICMISMAGTSKMLISTSDWAFANSILDCYRSCLTQSESENHETLSDYVFGDALVCLYSLWLASDTRSIGEDDVLHTQSQIFLPPTSTFAPICSHIFRTYSLQESEEVLFVFTSMFRAYRLPRLEASFWACALYHIEEREIGQKLVDKEGGDIIRAFKMRLVECVDKAENRCFAVSPRVVARRVGDTKSSRDGECSDGHSPSAQWRWEASVGCWIREDESNQDDTPATPKRRKVVQGSRLSTQTPSPHSISFRSASTGTAAHGTCISPAYDHNFLLTSPYNPENARNAPREFFRLLTNAVSSRASLHNQPQYPTSPTSQDRRIVKIENDLDTDDSDSSGLDSNGFNYISATRTPDFPSEDHLDLFKIDDTSPLISRRARNSVNN